MASIVCLVLSVLCTQTDSTCKHDVEPAVCGVVIPTPLIVIATLRLSPGAFLVRLRSNLC